MMIRNLDVRLIIVSTKTQTFVFLYDCITLFLINFIFGHLFF